MTEHVFARLRPLDPGLAQALAVACRRNDHPLPQTLLEEVVNLILAAFEQEIHLGASVAEGGRILLEAGTAEALNVFSREMRRAAADSTALGLYLADLLPTILLARDEALWESFQKTLAIFRAKGDYLIKAPLEPLASLMALNDDTAKLYLQLLQTVFNRALSYNRCQYLGNLLPRAIQAFPAPRRRDRIRQMIRLARRDLDLLDPFLEGLARGLDLLSPPALHRFVGTTLERRNAEPEDTRRFLALRSGRSRETLRGLQTAAVLKGFQSRLNRYVAARTGCAGRIRPAAAGGPWEALSSPTRPRSGTDGIYIYLPEIVDCLATREDNARLLTAMAKFETGLIECGTFAFDLERARDLGCHIDLPPQLALLPATGSDLAAFIGCFEDTGLARDLFTLYEHARVRIRLTRAYPGLVAGGQPLYQAAVLARLAVEGPLNLLDACYAVLVLEMPPARVLLPEGSPERAFVDAVQAELAAARPETMRVEHCADLVVATYPRFREALKYARTEATRLSPPYRCLLQPERVADAFRVAERSAERLKERIEAHGVKLYRGDLRQLLVNADGLPRMADILALAGNTTGEGFPEGAAAERILRRISVSSDPTITSGETEEPDDVDRITWLKEWNAAAGDYLHDYVRVRDRRLTGADTAFFDDVLQRSAGLVRRLRRSFELLRPEGLGLLRQWVEGDDFDYRALLDFALDRKAGRLPSDRLYIKRVKQRRDVAVLLLVDLSRSTSNIVEGSTETVLDVTKKALVLFTQALEVVGDPYALAGFSGTGRLGVDYFHIKHFDAPLCAGVKATLSGLAPQRSTRMGAAVRRAAMDLAGRENRVRLLLMIGDGFPNDAEYKGDYAVQDTRRAIAEARSKGIITQAITVNLPTSPQLDDLYGPVRHTVISHVDELPDKLLRLYGALTRP